MVRFLLASCWLLSAGIQCTSPRPDEVPSAPTSNARVPSSASGAPSLLPPHASSEAPPKPDATQLCLARIAETRRRPSLTAVQQSDAVRQSLLTTVKAVPVIFERAPEPEPSDDPVVRSFRRWWRQSPHPGGVLQKLLDTVPAAPNLLRSVSLREGYLYAEDLAHASALVRLLRSEQLFDAPEIWLQRGEETFHASRQNGQYQYTDGPLRGQAVALVLFDRMGTGAIPEPLHLDVRALRYKLGFERMRVVHWTEEALVAELFYGPYSVPSLLKRDGAHLSLDCESPDPSQRPALEAWRRERRALNTAFRSVQLAIAKQIQDGLPFDEPLHEIGQEDGKLRGAWLRAYDQGWDAFRFHDDVYQVFGPRGQAWVPEVCVDFLLDTLERAAGTWWAPRWLPRERHVGKLDFSSFDRDQLRRVPEFVNFASLHPEWFEVRTFTKREQIPIGSPHFLPRLAADAASFVPGDLVIIGGYVPWDARAYTHYHSLFVYDSDPITGMPILIASNPGRPRQVTWLWEAGRTPRRTLRYRIRLKADWLARAVEPAATPIPPFALTSPWAFGQ
jgi:hypothetical protein